MPEKNKSYDLLFSFGYRVMYWYYPPIMEHQMEKNMENEMGTTTYRDYMGVYKDM